MIGENAIYDEVESLAHLDLTGLRAAWRRRYGEPPKMRSKDMFARLLAWRIQSDVFGGLDEWTIKAIQSDRPPPPQVNLVPGTRLAREWRGRRYEVEILNEGIGYDGERYGSLSEVARKITGTRWNGLRFFGVRDGAAR